MATHSSILAWKIPWTEEPGRLQSTGSQRVGHHWTHMHAPLTWAPNNNQPTQVSEHIYMTVVISSKISSVVTATSHSNDPAPSRQKPRSGSLGRVPHRHLRGRWEDFLKDFLITMAEIKQLLIYTPCLTVFSMIFLWSWKLHKCLNGLSKQWQRTFPVGQWIRLCLLMQGTWVDPWSRKISHALGQLSLCTTTIETELLSPGATTTEHMSHNNWSPHTPEPMFHNKRSHFNKKPAHRN